MHRNMIGVSATLALLAIVAGYPQMSRAQDGETLCNALLDGDGDPVKDADADDVAHSGSAPCADAPAVVATTPPAPVEQVALVEQTVAVEPLTVYFDVGEDDLSSGAEAELQTFADNLVASNPSRVRVVGYTDTSGPADLNAQLSKSRAASVTAALVDAGVPAGLISEGAEGEQALAVATPDGAREPSNRRVTVSPEY